MFLQRDFAFLDKGPTDIGTPLTNSLPLLVCLSLWKTQAEYDDEYWWAGTKPKKLGRVYQYWFCEYH